MREEKHFELTKSGKAFILLGSIFVILGLAIDNYMIIIPGILFLIVISSTLVNFLISQNFKFDVEISASKEYLRSRGTIQKTSELDIPLKDF